MGKWDKVIEYLNTTKAEPEKVLKSLQTIYSQTKNSSSAYHTLRSSWPIDVVWNIYNKQKLLEIGLNQMTMISLIECFTQDQETICIIFQVKKTL